MSFDNIQLPDFLLADLYKDTLVELDNIKPLAQQAPTVPAVQPTATEQFEKIASIRHLGENKRQVCILVNDEDATFINDNDLQFLTNVLKACKLTLGDIAIINTNKHPCSYSQLAEELNPSKVLLFGLEPSSIELPISFPNFQRQNFGGCTYLTAPALCEINQASEMGKQAKVQLWTNLQTIFGL